MKKYEFMEVTPLEGDRRVWDYQLNELGQEGWSVAYIVLDGGVVMMQREIEEKPYSMFNYDSDGDIQ